MGALQLQYNPFLNASMQQSLGNTISMSAKPTGRLAKGKTKKKRKTIDSSQAERTSTSMV